MASCLCAKSKDLTANVVGDQFHELVEVTQIRPDGRVEKRQV
jgi:hypothetical protein